MVKFSVYLNRRVFVMDEDVQEVQILQSQIAIYLQNQIEEQTKMNTHSNDTAK